MEEKSKIMQTVEHAKQYAETRWELMILNASDKVSSLISTFASSLILMLIVVFVLLFTSIGVAWYIGDMYDSPSMGFLLVAAFYVVTGIIVYAMRNTWIKLPVVNAILKKFNYNEED